MDTLAQQQDEVLARLGRQAVPGECGPKLDEGGDPEHWLSQTGAPKPQLANERPPGETVPYDELIQAWREGRAR